MKHSPRRGAARVSAVWLIVLIVLFLVGVAFAYIANSDMALAQEVARVAVIEKTQAVERFELVTTARSELAEPIGWYSNPDAALKETNIPAMATALGDVRDAFGLDQTFATVEKILPELLATHRADRRKIGELESRISSLDSSLREAQRTTTQVSSQKDDQIRTLTQQISDEQRAAQQRQRDLEEAKSRLQQQVADTDSRSRQLQNEVEDSTRQFNEFKRTAETRFKELGRVTSFAREPFADRPDARVLEVSNSLPLGWIDIGSNNRLAEGTVFDVYSGSVGTRRLKARATVRSTEPAKSEVVFFDLADRFEPVVSGDILVNRLYDPTGERNAVLVGRFDGASSRADLVSFLSRIRINVQPKLDLTTHYLIVGGELYTDENGDPLEEPQQPSELPDYRDGVARGCVVIPIQEVRGYFKL